MSKPVFAWKRVDLNHVRWQDPWLIRSTHTIELDSEYDGRCGDGRMRGLGQV